MLGFFTKYIFENNLGWGASVWYISLYIFLWLIPIFFLVLFAQNKYGPVAAFILGILGFLTIEQNLYIFLGLLFLALAFGYWLSRVRHTQKNAIAFSVLHVFSGISFFFTILAIFGGLLSFYSPFANQVSREPKIPEKFLDSIYDPIANIVLGQLNEQIKSQMPGAPLLQDTPVPDAKTIRENTLNYKIPNSVLQEARNNNLDQELPTPEQLKPEFYRSINGTVTRLATQYQAYIPFAFALSTFLLLKTIFPFLKYLLLGCVFVLINLFIRIGWLKKEKQQVEVELIKI